ncbi:MAG: hypothetical protein RBS01_03990 [Candidatus Dojkabacteria bacterium]|jgi:GTP-sensing pleiotropic transcriptional regulator CodY|nr:hypothetical protein [Candidatus Dojkabacteria bacterium]
MIILNLAMLFIAVFCTYVILQIDKEVERNKRTIVYVLTGIVGFFVISLLAAENISNDIRAITYSLITISYLGIIAIEAILELPYWEDWDLTYW